MLCPSPEITQAPSIRMESQAAFEQILARYRDYTASNPFTVRYFNCRRRIKERVEINAWKRT